MQSGSKIMQNVTRGKPYMVSQKENVEESFGKKRQPRRLGDIIRPVRLKLFFRKLRWCRIFRRFPLASVH